jgi:serine/threonine protein kinase
MPTNDQNPPDGSNRDSSEAAPDRLDADALEAIIDRFEAAWQSGTPPQIEAFSTEHSAGGRTLLAELIQIEWEYRLKGGETPTVEQYRERFPALFVDDVLATQLAAVEYQWRHRASGAAALATGPILKSGSVVGPWTIAEPLGQGAMGHVFKAIHEETRQVVALKVIARRGDWGGETLRRFRRETQLVKRLTHPNIVTALDASEAGGVHYLALELVDGVDLGQSVARFGPLAVDSAIDYSRQAARGLSYAHRQGIVHRDVKPSNLIVDRHGVVKVLDLGLAGWRSAADAAGSMLTATGQVFGTIDYMSPEQTLTAKNADERSDIYALGCTLWFLLTATVVYPRKNVTERMIAHCREPIPSLRAVNAAVPLGLDAAFARMVAKSPADRFQSMDDVVAALSAI